MKANTPSAPFESRQEHRPIRSALITSVFLLGASTLGAWLSCQCLFFSGLESVHQRLLMILMVQPLALAAWFFCGLTSVGLAFRATGVALGRHCPSGAVAGLGIIVLALVSTSLFVS